MNISLVKKVKKNIGLIIFFLVITFIAYGPSLNNQFVWDDEQFIYNNAYVLSGDVKNIFTQNTIAGAGESSTYYRPLTTLSFAIDHAIWGLNPFGFHLTNTLLHLGAGLLLFSFLKTLKFSKQVSIFITTVFLIHPLQTEAVVYANSRGDSMYAFFAFLSLLLFSLLITNRSISLKIYDLKLQTTKLFLAVGTVCTYVLTILSKEIGIATIGLLGITFLHYTITHKKIRSISSLIKRNVHEVVVLILGFSSAAAYMMARAKIISIANSQTEFFAGTSYGNSIYTRLHTFTQALWKYFELIFIPYPLHMERDIPIIESAFSLYLLATIFLIVTVLLLIALEYKKNKSTVLAFGSLWFLGMLAPVSGIVPINGLIYEHWLYTPIIGFCLAMYAVVKIIFSDKLQQVIFSIIKMVFPVIVVIYIALTIRQNYLWANPIRFYTYTLQFTETPRLRNNLAMAYAQENEYAKAIENYQKAIQIGDFYPQTHFNLANSYAAVGATDLAKKEYLIAIKMNESFYPAYSPLIQILLAEEDFENATNLLEKVVEANPNNIDLQLFYAQILIKTDDISEAEKVLTELSKKQLPTQKKLQIRDLLLQTK